MNIVITGASRGLGLELTRIYLEDQHSVCALARHSSNAMETLRARFPDRLQFREGDVAEEQDISEFRRFAERNMKSVDILVNNAAVLLDPGREDIEKIDVSVYTAAFQINSIGPLVMVKHFLPLLRRGERKLIATISSEAGSIGDSTRENGFSYCMSKAAVNMAMKMLQNRLKREGIKVLAIHPGWVRTDMGGRGADLDVSESARAVLGNVIERHSGLDDGIYFDWTGRELNW